MLGVWPQGTPSSHQQWMGFLVVNIDSFAFVFVYNLNGLSLSCLAFNATYVKLVIALGKCTTLLITFALIRAMSIY